VTLGQEGLEDVAKQTVRHIGNGNSRNFLRGVGNSIVMLLTPDMLVSTTVPSLTGRSVDGLTF
jgi:hypothetical protein